MRVYPSRVRRLSISHSQRGFSPVSKRTPTPEPFERFLFRPLGPLQTVKTVKKSQGTALHRAESRGVNEIKSKLTRYSLFQTYSSNAVKSGMIVGMGPPY